MSTLDLCLLWAGLPMVVADVADRLGAPPERWGLRFRNTSYALLPLLALLLPRTALHPALAALVSIGIGIVVVLTFTALVPAATEQRAGIMALLAAFVGGALGAVWLRGAFGLGIWAFAGMLWGVLQAALYPGAWVVQRFRRAPARSKAT